MKVHEGKNYNPMMHCEQHNQIKTIEKHKATHLKMLIIYESNIC